MFQPDYQLIELNPSLPPSLPLIEAHQPPEVSIETRLGGSDPADSSISFDSILNRLMSGID